MQKRFVATMSSAELFSRSHVNASIRPGDPLIGSI